MSFGSYRKRNQDENSKSPGGQDAEAQEARAEHIYRKLFD